MEQLLSILHEDHDRLVINKPAGLVCHPTKEDNYSSLIGRVRLHLGEATKPHMINRLDRETSGVVVVAKNIETARSLRRIWERREVRKVYIGIVHGFLEENSGIIEAPLGPDDESLVSIKNCVRPDGAPAKTAFRALERFERGGQRFTSVQIEPETGRKHQIRIHFSYIGHPVVGDKLYGGDENLYLDFVSRRLTSEQRCMLIVENHALHALMIIITSTIYHAPPPSTWELNFGSNVSKNYLESVTCI